MMFFVETLVEKYSEGIELLRDTLFHVDFTAERAESMVGQLLGAIPEMKLSSGSVASALVSTNTALIGVPKRVLE